MINCNENEENEGEYNDKERSIHAKREKGSPSNHWKKGFWLKSLDLGLDRGLATAVDAEHPLVFEALVNAPPRLGIRVEHLLEDVSTLARKVRDRARDGAAMTEVGRGIRRRSVRRGGRRKRRSINLEVSGEGLVGATGKAPRKLLQLHAVVDDATGPDIDEPRIVFYDGKMIRTRRPTRCTKRKTSARSGDSIEPHKPLNVPFCSNCSGAM